MQLLNSYYTAGPQQRNLPVKFSHSKLFVVPASSFWSLHGLTLLGRLLFVGCLEPLQHASVPHGWICSDSRTCCQTETEVADQTFYLIVSQYTDTEPTSPSADPINSKMPGTWHGSYWTTNNQVTGMTPHRKRSMAKVGIEPQSAALALEEDMDLIPAFSMSLFSRSNHTSDLNGMTRPRAGQQVMFTKRALFPILFLLSASCLPSFPQ